MCDLFPPAVSLPGVDMEIREVDYETAAEYFAGIIDGLTDADHAAVRARGATIAARGHVDVSGELDRRVVTLAHSLEDEPEDRLVAVIAGRVMRLDDYLFTRILEQTVHLDDLARSIDAEPWDYPPDTAALVIALGAEIGRLRFGDQAMLRTLYRDGPPTLPVL